MAIREAMKLEPKLTVTIPNLASEDLLAAVSKNIFGS